MSKEENISEENSKNENSKSESVNENNSQEQPIESFQPQIQNSQLQTENMEVHHHPQEKFQRIFTRRLNDISCCNAGFLCRKYKRKSG